MPPGTLAYDYKNRMVQFTETVSGKRHTYTYDALGRLIKKVVDADGLPAEMRYYYKGWQVVEERDGTDTVQATYVYGNFIDEVLTMRRLDADFYYLRDDQYNVMRITDPNGVVVESYDYSDFGVPLDATTRQPLTGSAVGNPFFFTGRRFDWETRLYDYRTRWYDPIAGRFTSRDSIGIWGDEVNLGNAFAYVGNNPWTYVDPDGRGLGQFLLDVFVGIVTGGVSGAVGGAVVGLFGGPGGVGLGATIGGIGGAISGGIAAAISSLRSQIYGTHSYKRIMITAAAAGLPGGVTMGALTFQIADGVVVLLTWIVGTGAGAANAAIQGGGKREIIFSAISAAVFSTCGGIAVTAGNYAPTWYSAEAITGYLFDAASASYSEAIGAWNSYK